MADELLFKIDLQGNEKAMQDLAKLKGEMLLLGKAYTDLNGQLKTGKVSLDQYSKSAADLDAKKKALKTDTDNLNRSINQEQAAFKGAEGSMVRINAELGAMRERYRNLSAAERENMEIGGKLLTQIQAHDAQIKKLDASIGNHQRNVGNYPGLMGMFGSAMSSNIPIIGAVSGSISQMKDTLSQATGAVAGQGKGMLMLAGAVGIGIAAFGALAGVVKHGIDLAMDEEKAEGRLRFVLNGNVEAMQRMTKWKEVMRTTSIFTKDEINNAVNMGLSLGRTESQTMEMVKAAMALNKATLGKIDIDQAMLQLSGTLEGTLGRLKRYTGDLTVEQLKSGDAISIINERYGKFIHGGLDTTAGRLTQAKKHWDEFLEGIGTKGLTIFDKLYTKWNYLIDRFAFIKSNYGTGAAIGDFAGASGDPLKDPEAIKLQKYLKWKEKALEESALKTAEFEAKIKGVKGTSVADTEKDDEKLIKAEKEKRDAAEKARKDQQERDQNRFDAIKSNNDYILQLTRQGIDQQIAVMEDGKDKEIAIANDRQQDEVIAINKERRDRLEAIQKTIKDTKAQGEELKTLQDQEVKIKEIANKRIEQSQENHVKELAKIDKKYSKSDEDQKIQTKYSQDVAKVDEEGKMKLAILRQFYADKGTLTKAEEIKLKDEELKLAIEVAQKKYDLLYAEIQARKALGTISQEDYDKQLQNISRLYGEVKKLGGDQKENADSGKKKPDAVTGGIMSMFDIPESEANQIKQKVGDLLQQIGQMWLQAQSQRIQSELKSETKKVDDQAKHELKALEQKKKKGLITEKQFNEQKEKLDEQTAKKKDDLQRQAFEKEKKLKILSAIMSGALAVVQMLANPGGIAGIVLAALAAITAGIEIATIAGTKYEGARGGMLSGPSHKNGGIKYAMGGNIVELEGDEAVLNKRSMASPDRLTLSGTPRQIASDLNSYKGYGVSFASGGYVPVSTPRTSGVRVERNSVSDVVNDQLQTLRVVVVESDITEVQGKVKKIQVESQW